MNTHITLIHYHDKITQSNIPSIEEQYGRSVTAHWLELEYIEVIYSGLRE